MKIAVLAFCIAFLSSALTALPALADDLATYSCAGNTMEQHECLGKAFKEADQELNTTYQSLIRLVRNHGEEWVKDLRAAQRKWIEFRNLNCTFYGNYLQGGTGSGLYLSACKVRMTKERAAELNAKRMEMKGRGYEEKN